MLKRLALSLAAMTLVFSLASSAFAAGAAADTTKAAATKGKHKHSMHRKHVKGMKNAAAADSSKK